MDNVIVSGFILGFRWDSLKKFVVQELNKDLDNLFFGYFNIKMTILIFKTKKPPTNISQKKKKKNHKHELNKKPQIFFFKFQNKNLLTAK